MAILLRMLGRLPSATFLVAVTFALLCLLAGVALAADGDLDPSFDGDGRLISEISVVDDRPRDIAIDQQGRLVVVGVARDGGSSIALVARYNPDGTLDKSLGGDGEVSVEWTNDPESPRSVAIDSQGRIVLGGSVSTGTGSAFAVARLQSNGLPDGSFSGDGREIVDTAGVQDIGDGVAVDAQDRVLLAGSTDLGGQSTLALLRFTQEGELDPDFGAGGLATADFGGESNGAGLALDAQGRAVVSGFAASQFAAARFGIDGSLDETFDLDGKATLDFGQTPSESASDLAIDSQGRILLTGDGTAGGITMAHVGRLTPAGASDGTFDGDGRVTLALPESAYAYRVAVDPGGRIVVAGELESPTGDTDALLVRLRPDSATDASFGTGGFVREDFLAVRASATGLAIDAGGRYVIVGEARGGASDAFGLARFLASYPVPGVPIRVEERLSCAGQTATIEGTGKHDVLRGTGRRDVIVALGGHDRIAALGGNDLVCAGAGRDFVQAGRGNDRVLGGHGPDRILGGAGRDMLLGEGGGDLLSGGPARDNLRGGPGRDDQRQ